MLPVFITAVHIFKCGCKGTNKCAKNQIKPYIIIYFHNASSSNWTFSLNHEQNKARFNYAMAKKSAMTMED